MTKPVSAIAFQTPDEAEAAFYKAFEQGDLEAMMAVWMDGEIVCIHPMGTLLTGTQAVRTGWQQLFTNFLINSYKRINFVDILLKCTLKIYVS